VKATRLLRGKELAFIGSDRVIELIIVTTLLRHLGGCFLLLLPTVTHLELVQRDIPKDPNPKNIFRPSFVIGLTAFTETPASTSIDGFYLQDCIHHFYKGNTCNFLTAFSYPEKLFID
jgi:hypothetical protein